jgi:hypothetical protein
MSRQYSTARSLLALLSALTLGACASTGIAESWVDPGTKQLPRFQKVFVAYMGTDAAAQRLAEDSIAKHLAAPEVVKSYVLYPDARGLDPVRVKDELRAQGCDGAVMMRLARIEQEISATSTDVGYHRSFGGYWGHGYGAPIEVRTDEIVHMETNLYSLAEDKLLYSARSETFNPSSTEDLVDEIAAAIAKDLEKRGLKR